MLYIWRVMNYIIYMYLYKCFSFYIIFNCNVFVLNINNVWYVIIISMDNYNLIDFYYNIIWINVDVDD